MAVAHKASVGSNGTSVRAGSVVRIEAVTAKTIDDFISRINPRPSEEDTDDIFAIQQAVMKMVIRRNAQLVAVILEKDKRISELVALLEKAHEEPPAPPEDDGEIVDPEDAE